MPGVCQLLTIPPIAASAGVPARPIACRARKGKADMCLFAVLAGFFPRIAFAVYWIARPTQVDLVFGSFIWPLLGLIFLPFTTLMYTILWSAGGLQGWDWLWVGI